MFYSGWELLAPAFMNVGALSAELRHSNTTADAAAAYLTQDLLLGNDDTDGSARRTHSNVAKETGCVLHLAARPALSFKEMEQQLHRRTTGSSDCFHVKSNAPAISQAAVVFMECVVTWPSVQQAADAAGAGAAERNAHRDNSAVSPTASATSKPTLPALVLGVCQRSLEWYSLPGEAENSVGFYVAQRLIVKNGYEDGDAVKLPDDGRSGAGGSRVNFGDHVGCLIDLVRHQLAFTVNKDIVSTLPLEPSLADGSYYFAIGLARRPQQATDVVVRFYSGAQCLSQDVPLRRGELPLPHQQQRQLPVFPLAKYVRELALQSVGRCTTFMSGQEGESHIRRSAAAPSSEQHSGGGSTVAAAHRYTKGKRPDVRTVNASCGRQMPLAPETLRDTRVTAVLRDYLSVRGMTGALQTLDAELHELAPAQSQLYATAAGAAGRGPAGPSSSPPSAPVSARAHLSHVLWRPPTPGEAQEAWQCYAADMSRLRTALLQEVACSADGAPTPPLSALLGQLMLWRPSLAYAFASVFDSHVAPRQRAAVMLGLRQDIRYLVQSYQAQPQRLSFANGKEEALPAERGTNGSNSKPGTTKSPASHQGMAGKSSFCHSRIFSNASFAPTPEAERQAQAAFTSYFTQLVWNPARVLPSPMTHICRASPLSGGTGAAARASSRDALAPASLDALAALAGRADAGIVPHSKRTPSAPYGAVVPAPAPSRSSQVCLLQTLSSLHTHTVSTLRQMERFVRHGGGSTGFADRTALDSIDLLDTLLRTVQHRYRQQVWRRLVHAVEDVNQQLEGRLRSWGAVAQQPQRMQPSLAMPSSSQVPPVIAGPRRWHACLDGWLEEEDDAEDGEDIDRDAAVPEDDEATQRRSPVRSLMAGFSSFRAGETPTHEALVARKEGEGDQPSPAEATRQMPAFPSYEDLTTFMPSLRSLWRRVEARAALEPSLHLVTELFVQELRRSLDLAPALGWRARTSTAPCATPNPGPASSAAVSTEAVTSPLAAVKSEPKVVTIYAVAGHALPLPPKRTPPRYSTITRSEEQECRISVRANSPGRAETPRDGEISPVAVALQRESQLGYRGEAAHPPPEDSKHLAPPTLQKSKVPSSRLAGPSTPRQQSQKSTELELDDLSSCFSSHCNSAPDTNAKMHAASEFLAQGGYATPPHLNMTAVVPEDGSSIDSRPSLNRTKFEAADRNVVPARPIETSRTRRSQAPANHHSTPVAAAPASGTRSTATQSTLSRYNHSKGCGAYSGDQRQQAESTDGAPQKHQQQQPRPRGAPATEAAAHPAASAASSAGSSRRRGVSSHERSPSEASSYRRDKHSARSAPVCYVEQHSRSPVRNNRAALLSSPVSVDPHLTHEYSQQKMEERRASKSRVVPSSQSTAVVVVSSNAWNSIRTSRNGEDPLEMSVPIAERVNFMSTLARHRDSSASVPMGTLEGTELLPGLPQLQGHRNDDNADRPYRTIIRFIEYQPKGERPGLEEILASYSGREDALCCALGEAYGDDFEMLKLGCSHTPAVPLLADRPLPTSAPPPHKQSYVVAVPHKLREYPVHVALRLNRAQPRERSLLTAAADAHVRAPYQHTNGGDGVVPQEWREIEDKYKESSSKPMNVSRDVGEQRPYDDRVEESGAQGLSGGPAMRTTRRLRPRRCAAEQKPLVLHASLVDLLNAENALWTVSLGTPNAASPSVVWTAMHEVRVETQPSQSAASLLFMLPPPTSLRHRAEDAEEEKYDEDGAATGKQSAAPGDDAFAQTQRRKPFGHLARSFHGVSCEEYRTGGRGQQGTVQGRCFFLRDDGEDFFVRYEATASSSSEASGAEPRIVRSASASGVWTEHILLGDSAAAGAKETSAGAAEEHVRVGDVTIDEYIREMADARRSKQVVLKLAIAVPRKAGASADGGQDDLMHVRLECITDAFYEAMVERSTGVVKAARTSFFYRWVWPVLFVTAIYAMLAATARLVAWRKASQGSVASATAGATKKKQQ
ncbi:hypothetical protein CGC20_12325 [Leishmania donovani]|uniref:B30.2/SPRY domain-containing protein n=1 Tax=Leishmania donovani TaxID=5661 RepID=A0A504XJ88_LEIDO|nr:hypothetical protein CGC20_12325 [Leishmania donovani]